MDRETNRQEILKLMDEMHIDEDVLYDMDMWLVSIVVLTPFNTYDTHKALFHDRGDAEQWLSYKTKGKPYYAYCCDKNYWNREEELLKKKFRME